MTVDHTLTWEVARAGGLVAYLLLTASVVIGLLLSLKAHSAEWPRFLTNELHRHVTLLAIVFVVIHGLAVWIDPFTGFTPLEVLVPMAAHYRPLWLALGITGGYLIVAVYLSERVRRHVGYRLWHAFHLLSFVAFVFAALHGLGSGSDSQSPWALALYGSSLAIVFGLLVARVGRSLARTGRVAVNLTAAVVAAALVVFAVLGPARSGWNAFANGGQGNGASTAWLASHPVAAEPSAFSTDIQIILAEDGLLTGSFGGSNAGRVELLLTQTTAALGMVFNSGWSCEGPAAESDQATVVARCVAADGSALSVQLADLRRADDAVLATLRVNPGS